MKKKESAFRPQVAAFALYMLLSAVMLVFSAGTFALDFKKIGFSAISAAQIGVQKTISAAVSAFAAARELAALREDYKALVEKMADYENLRRDNAEMSKENARLREQLGFAASLDRKNIPAQIVARDASSLYSAITIDKGVRDGIRKNMQVVAFQNGNVGLVGKIVEAGRFASMVIPVYDFQFNVSTRVQTSRDLGLSSGLGSAERGLSMQYVRKTSLESIRYGDLVVTSGENGNFDREIPVGTVSRVEAVEYNSSLAIELSPVIDFNRLETVVVVAGGGEAQK